MLRWKEKERQRQRKTILTRIRAILADEEEIKTSSLIRYVEVPTSTV